MSGIFTRRGLPTKSVDIKSFTSIKNKFQSLPFQTYWNCGSSGMLDDGYPYQINPNKIINDIDVFVKCDRKELEPLLNDYEHLITGNTIHVLYDNIQIDFICMKNADTSHKHHIHDYNTKYDTNTKIKLLCELINNIEGFEHKYFQYYALGGELRIRELGIVLSYDIDEIVKYIQDDFNVEDLKNVESIMGKFNNKEFIQKLGLI